MKKISFLLYSCLAILSASAQSNISQLDNIKTHLVQSVDYKLLPSDVKEIEVTDSHTDARKITYIYLRQAVNGLPIFNGTATVAVKNKLIVHTASRLIGNVSRRITSTNFLIDHIKGLEFLIETVNVVD